MPNSNRITPTSFGRFPASSSSINTPVETPPSRSGIKLGTDSFATDASASRKQHQQNPFSTSTKKTGNNNHDMKNASTSSSSDDDVVEDLVFHNQQQQQHDQSGQQLPPPSSPAPTTPLSPKIPKGKNDLRAYLVVLAVALTQGAVYGTSTSYPVYLSHISSDSGLGFPTQSVLSLAQTIYLALNIPLGMVAGVVMDKFGSKYVLASTGIGLVLAGILGSYAESTVLFLSVYGLFIGVATSCINSPGPSTVGHFFTGDKVSFAIGLTIMGSAIGICTIPLVTSFVLDILDGDWRSTMRWMSIIGIVPLIANLIFIPPIEVVDDIDEAAEEAEEEFLQEQLRQSTFIAALHHQQQQEEEDQSVMSTTHHQGSSKKESPQSQSHKKKGSNNSSPPHSGPQSLGVSFSSKDNNNNKRGSNDNDETNPFLETQPPPSSNKNNNSESSSSSATPITLTSDANKPLGDESSGSPIIPSPTTNNKIFASAVKQFDNTHNTSATLSSSLTQQQQQQQQQQQNRPHLATTAPTLRNTTPSNNTSISFADSDGDHNTMKPSSSSFGVTSTRNTTSTSKNNKTSPNKPSAAVSTSPPQHHVEQQQEDKNKNQIPKRFIPAFPDDPESKHVKSYRNYNKNNNAPHSHHQVLAHTTATATAGSRFPSYGAMTTTLARSATASIGRTFTPSLRVSAMTPGSHVVRTSTYYGEYLASTHNRRAVASVLQQRYRSQQQQQDNSQLLLHNNNYTSGSVVSVTQQQPQPTPGGCTTVMSFRESKKLQRLSETTHAISCCPSLFSRCCSKNNTSDTSDQHHLLGDSKQQKQQAPSAIKFLFSPSFIVLGLCMFCFGYGFFGFNFGGIPFAKAMGSNETAAYQNEPKISAELASTTFTFYGAAQAIGALCLGALATKIGDSRVLSIFFFLGSMSMFLLAYVMRLYFELCIIYCVVGLLAAACLVCLPSLIVHCFSHDEEALAVLGTIMSAAFAMFNLGGSIAPFLFSFLQEQDADGSYSNSFLVAAILLLIAGVIMVGYFELYLHIDDDDDEDDEEEDNNNTNSKFNDEFTVVSEATTNFTNAAGKSQL